MKDILTRIEEEVRIHDKPENRINYQQFFKERLDEPVGLKTPLLRRISNKLFREEIRPLRKDEVLEVCDRILASSSRYARFFAFDWAQKVAAKLEERDFGRLERWLKTVVNNWGACDHICCGALGSLIARHPQLSEKRSAWTRSKNRWERRAASVSLIPAIKEGLLLKDVLETALLVLRDEDDMVQKGYGWMLKVAGATFPEEVRDFVLENKLEMPRTALRYAIEKWPPDLRALALERK